MTETAVPAEPVHEQYDFIAAASVPTNEQRMVAALETLNEGLVRFETRLFAYINALPKPATGPGPGGPKLAGKK